MIDDIDDEIKDYEKNKENTVEDILKDYRKSLEDKQKDIKKNSDELVEAIEEKLAHLEDVAAKLDALDDVEVATVAAEMRKLQDD